MIVVSPSPSFAEVKGTIAEDTSDMGEQSFTAIQWVKKGMII